MDGFIELAWTPFLAVFWWFMNRLTARIDQIENSKVDKAVLDRVDNELHEMEKRQEKLIHTTVPRPEYKADVTSLHSRINELSTIKQDKVKDINLVNFKDKDKNK